MTIHVTCKQCGARFRVKDAFAGRKTSCEKCNSPLSIPTLKLDAAHNPADELSQQVASTTPSHSGPTKCRRKMIVVIGVISLVVFSLFTAPFLAKVFWPRIKGQFDQGMQDLEETRKPIIAP